MEDKVFEIYFTYRGMPCRRVRGSVEEVNETIKWLVMKGAAIQKIVEW